VAGPSCPRLETELWQAGAWWEAGQGRSTPEASPSSEGKAGNVSKSIGFSGFFQYSIHS